MGCCMSRKKKNNGVAKSKLSNLSIKNEGTEFPLSEILAPSRLQQNSSGKEDDSSSLSTVLSCRSTSCPIKPNGGIGDQYKKPLLLMGMSTQDQQEKQKVGQEEAFSPPQPPESFPYYITAPIETLHKKLYEDLFKLLTDEGLFFNSKKGRSHSPFEFKSPNELKNEIDFELGNAGVNHDALLEIVSGVVRFQPRPGHPFNMEQSLAGLEPYTCISGLISTCISSNDKYIVSNVLALLESEMIQAICKLVGYNGFGNGDGAIVNGSILANTYAIKMAVRRKFPLMKRKGLAGCKRPVVFVSTASVYIHRKCAIFQGLGTDSIIPVDIDEFGRMNVEDLEEKIKDCLSLKRDLIPCMVVGTAGTNIFRALDPLDKIANVCKRFELWFHVDGTWDGGALLFSETLRDKLIGLQRSDSFAWSQHFVLSCTCTCLVTPPRHKDKLAQFTNLGDDTGNAYMEPPLYDQEYDDARHNTLVSPERAEMLKFWLMWKAKGTNDLGRHVDYVYKNVAYCLEEMRKRGGFNRILDRFDGTNVCFVYVPIAYRGLVPNSEAYCEKVSKLTLQLARSLLVQGIVSLSYSEIPKKPTFLILSLHNSAVSRQDIQYVLDQIKHYGEKFGSVQ